MSYGKSSGSSGSAPVVSDLQKQYVANQAGLGTQAQNNLSGAAGQLPGLYNSSAAGANNASTNLANTANSLQQSAGQGGAQAYSNGINALSNIASPAYQQAEMNAALIPAEQQYQQNMASQNAGFGGAGQIGSARSALANQQTALLAQQNQQQAAANVLNNITNQQQAAGSGLGSLGLQGGQLGLQAGQAGVGASQIPLSIMQQYIGLNNQLAAGGYGTPNFNGMVGQTGSTSGTNTGVSI